MGKIAIVTDSNSGITQKEGKVFAELIDDADIEY